MLTVIFLIVCVQLSLSPLVRVFVFFPALFAVQGFVQALLGFCFTFGFMSIADFGTTSHDRKKITVSEFQTQDKVRASGVLVMCVAIAGVITALVYYFL